MDTCALFAILLVFGLPTSEQFPREWARSPYSQHTLMLSNLYPRSAYNPEEFMSAFGGDAISTNTFADGENVDAEDPVATEVKRPQPSEEEISQFEEAEIQTEAAPEVPQTKKKVPSRKEEDVAEDNNSFLPFQPDPNTRNVFSSFFPVMIGGSPNSRGIARDGAQGYAPGSATAIANSFSTGRGGVASSHATSYGDPYMGMLFRNAVFKTRSTDKSQ